MTGWLLVLAPLAQAAEIAYEQALQEALQANAGVLGAAATVEAAEGAVVSAGAVFDPLLTAYAGRSLQTSEGLWQGLDSSSDIQNTTWGAALSGTLPTGTTFSLNWDNFTGPYSYTIDIGGVDTLVEGVQSSSSLNLSVTQQLLKGLRLSYNLEPVRAARRALAQARASQRAARQEVLAAVASAYWDLVEAREAVRAAERAVEAAEEERRVVAAQVEHGFMAPLESTRVEAALAQARMTLLEARLAARAASEALAVQLARDPTEPLEATTLPGDPVDTGPIDPEAAVQAALEGNPGLEVKRLAVADAEGALAAARHERLPSLSGTLAYGLQGFDADSSYAAAFNEMLSGALPTTTMTLNLSVPLLNRAARGNVRSLAAQVEQARFDLEQAERDLERQVLAQVRTLETSRRRVELADLNLELARETLRAEKALQEAGRAIQKNVLDAMRQVTEAEVEQVRARTAWRKALVQLKALQGAL